MAKKKTKETKEMVFSTGSDLMDLVVGGGLRMGYPGGRIINIVGDKSSGKTFLACEIIASAYYLYGDKIDWRYDDCESGFTFDTESMYGMTIMPEAIEDRTRSQTVEELYGNCRDFFENLPKGRAGIYVVDSLDGLSSKEVDDRGDERYSAHKRGKTYEKGSYQMGKAKFLSQEFFPQIANAVQKSNGLLIIISQTRDKIDSMFKAQTRSGGKALDFYAHTCLWLASIHKIKKRDRPVGVVVKAQAKKSKTKRPFRECVFTLRFDYGLDNIESNLDFLFSLRGDSGVLLKSAQEINWDGKSANLSDLKEWLEAIGRLEEYKTTVNATIKKGQLLEWIQSNEEVKKQYDSEFGQSRTKAELVDYIENNNLEDELKQRVVNKWEEIEADILTSRKPKYKKL